MLETDRLILRPFEETDVEAVFALRSDADVMRFIREPQNRDESAKWVKLVSSRWARERIGLCAVVEKAAGDVIGWCGLWRLPETEEVEVGYAIAKNFWRKGFAGEAARKVLEYGFDDLRLEKIVAVARPENTASRRVMEKLGMRYDCTGVFYGSQLVHYSITKDAWERREKKLTMLETERLLIRRFTFDDLEKLIETRSDEEVIKYLGGKRLQNPEAIAKRLPFYIDCYEKFGFGMCAMIWKASGEMFGWSGLQPLEDTGEIEVGYGMIKEFWGKGVGYECASAWLRYGFETANLERIVAIALPENKASWRIMEKCGMRYEKTETHYGSECVFYAISKSEFDKLNN